MFVSYLMIFYFYLLFIKWKWSTEAQLILIIDNLNINIEIRKVFKTNTNFAWNVNILKFHFFIWNLSIFQFIFYLFTFQSSDSITTNSFPILPIQLLNEFFFVSILERSDKDWTRSSQSFRGRVGQLLQLAVEQENRSNRFPTGPGWSADQTANRNWRLWVDRHAYIVIRH